MLLNLWKMNSILMFFVQYLYCWFYSKYRQCKFHMIALLKFCHRIFIHSYEYEFYLYSNICFIYFIYKYIKSKGLPAIKFIYKEGSYIRTLTESLKYVFSSCKADHFVIIEPFDKRIVLLGGLCASEFTSITIFLSPFSYNQRFWKHLLMT